MTQQRVQCPARVGARTKQSNILCSNVTGLAGVVLRQLPVALGFEDSVGDVRDTAASKTSRRLEQFRARTLQAVANSVSGRPEVKCPWQCVCVEGANWDAPPGTDLCSLFYLL